MNKEYKVTRHTIESTEEEKEIVYKQLANLFINMALKERNNTKEQKESDINGNKRLFIRWS